jgi:hypothetical protein
MTRLISFAVAGSLALLVVAVGGCSKPYVAEVRNDSGRVIHAGLYLSETATSGKLLAERRLGPGEKATLSRELYAGSSTVYVEADALGQAGVQPRKDLSPGRTILTVRSEGNRADSPLKFEVLSDASAGGTGETR